MTRHTRNLLIAAGAAAVGLLLWARFRAMPTVSSAPADGYRGGLTLLPYDSRGDAMKIIDDLIANNPFERRTVATEITGINPDAPKIYL